MSDVPITKQAHVIAYYPIYQEAPFYRTTDGAWTANIRRASLLTKAEAEAKVRFYRMHSRDKYRVLLFHTHVPRG